MRILLVSGGGIPIPPPRWGGVENLIWQQATALRAAGHEVDICNVPARGIKKVPLAISTKPWTYDIVHLHLDNSSKYWIPLTKIFKFNLLISTHYGYAAFPEHWNSVYPRIFQNLKKAPNLLLISPEIEKTFRRLGATARMFVLPNGINCASLKWKPKGTKDAICLARVEKRKKQTLLASKLDKTDVVCDFAGPIDPEIDFVVNERNTHYIGEWSRDQIQENLTDYRCLVLISDGEGHAAVLSEAMAAGVSLVVSPQASHNLDLSLPWIYAIDPEKDDIPAAIQKAIDENERYRKEIRAYCEADFDWKVIMPRYIEILEQIVAK
ncbi:hypothetical protein CCAX7_50940 [Capsulimonas corticalis]|uniref:Uncharacterized protein n=1 Tax=Capsulimonas corticalis TaxID=2219043 RepID=A0A402CPJ9_9BACT|nr:glycosyltransferase family 4 protein [Capsulimonas corticalis]BDI33043.1 hypothetical protein CCAX7_50940 [Capsulimonas corticalis]